MGFLIHKYPMQMVGRQSIEMPLGAEILSVQVQRETPCIWAVHHAPVTQTETRDFQIIGTGVEFQPLGTHIGTVQIGAYVWHVLEVTD